MGEYTDVQMLALPGYGEGRLIRVLPDMHSYAEYVSQRIDRDSILAGWSLGGMVALEVAKLNKHVKAAVLIASTPCFTKRDDWPHGVDRVLLENMHQELSTKPDRVMREFLGRVAMGDRSPKETIRILREQQMAHIPALQTLLDGLALLQNTDLRKTLGELSCPVIMLLGEEDRLIKTGSGAAAQHINPHVHIEYLPATGHAPFVSCPGETAQTIRSALPELLS